MGYDRSPRKKVALISPVGLSPPIVTEMVSWLIESEGVYLNTVDLIVTKNDEVRKSAELAVSALNNSPWKIKVNWYWIEHDDITDEESMWEFLSTISNIVYERKSKENVKEIYACISGGRKTQSALLMAASRFCNINRVFSIVNPDIKILNEQLERIRNYLDEHYMAEDLDEYYKSKKKIFDEVMFPDPSSYMVLEIPILPFPYDYLEKVGTLLTNPSGTPVVECKLDRNTLTLLAIRGLVTLSNDRVRPTHMGHALGRLLKGETI